MGLRCQLNEGFDLLCRETDFYDHDRFMISE
jgi:hypothetical protein